MAPARSWQSEGTPRVHSTAGLAIPARVSRVQGLRGQRNGLESFKNFSHREDEAEIG